MKHSVYVVPVCNLNTGVQVPINIIISLKRKNCLIITIIRLIINYLFNYYDYSINYYTRKFSLSLAIT